MHMRAAGCGGGPERFTYRDLRPSIATACFCTDVTLYDSTRSISASELLLDWEKSIPTFPRGLLKMSKIILYERARSSCSFRIRIALNLLGLDYDHACISATDGKGREYREKNPQGLVPFMIDGDMRISQVQSLSLDTFDFVTMAPCRIYSSVSIKYTNMSKHL